MFILCTRPLISEYLECFHGCCNKLKVVCSVSCYCWSQLFVIGPHGVGFLNCLSCRYPTGLLWFALHQQHWTRVCPLHPLKTCFYSGCNQKSVVHSDFQPWPNWNSQKCQWATGVGNQKLVPSKHWQENANSRYPMCFFCLLVVKLLILFNQTVSKCNSSIKVDETNCMFCKPATADQIK